MKRGSNATPKSTVASRLRTQASRKCEREIRDDAERMQRTQRLKAEVGWQAKLNGIRLSTPESIEHKVATLRVDAKVRAREYKCELSDMAKRVSERPLLMELEKRQSAIRWAEKRYSERLKSNGISEEDLPRLAGTSRSSSSFASAASSTGTTERSSKEDGGSVYAEEVEEVESQCSSMTEPSANVTS